MYRIPKLEHNCLVEIHGNL